MYSIKNIWWERVNLHLEFNKTIKDKKVFLVNKNNIILLDSSNDEVCINVTNTPEGTMLDKGNWRIYIVDKKDELDITDKTNIVTIEDSILKLLDDKSRIFSYNINKSYLVKLTTDDDLHLIIKISFMIENRKYKRRYILSGEPIKTKIKNILILIAIFIINVYYRLIRLFSFNKDKKILFLSENADELVGNLKSLHDYVENTNWKSDVYANNFYSLENKGKFKKIKIYIKEVFYLARTNNIFTDNYSVIMTFIKFNKKVKIIQLWHAGIGFKSVGYARFGLVGSPHPYLSSHRKYTHAVVDQDSLVKIYMEVFGNKKSIFNSFGMPRLDGYLDKETIDEKTKYLYSVNKDFENKKVILFSPTYRGKGSGDAYYDYSLIDLDKIYEYCKKNNALFVIKMHPFIKESINIPDKYKNLILDYSEMDINDLIYLSDIMITDYSSCAYEYSLFDRPLIFYRFDKELYEYLRPMHTVDAFTSKQYEVREFNELMDVLDKLKNIDIKKRFNSINNSTRKDSCKKIIGLLGENNG
ncbi:MAG: CDP-glycerol glycerophosphotransferase family protein [Bacilli bacterium]|nr:CDP-glycerol glycerophosphotransferase family protein [Bacilli bacterium]